MQTRRSAANSDPELTISFDLFKVYQRLRAILREALAHAPLQGDEFAIHSALLTLGETTQTELAEAVGMPMTIVAEYVRAMHRNGHLLRRLQRLTGAQTSSASAPRERARIGKRRWYSWTFRI